MQDSLQGIRLSAQQKRLWLLQDNEGAFCVHATVLLSGPVDPLVLQGTVARVVDRHEIFRTTFRLEPGLKLPFQVIGEQLAPRWRTVDWREHGPSNQEAELKILSDEQRRFAFDFERGPLLDVVLVRLAERRSVLLLYLPALCADAVTLQNLVREISDAYAACLMGEESAELSDEEPIQYAQFSEWQHELLEEKAGTGKQHWHRLAAATMPAMVIPCEQSVSRTANSAMGGFLSVKAPIDGETATKLDETARIHATSLMVVLFACWQALLFRLTGQRDAIVATLGDGRKYEDLHRTMGPLAKWLPIRCHTDARVSFIELASRAQVALGETLEWQEYCMWEEYRADAKTALADPVGFEYHELPAACQAGDLSFLLAEQAVRFDRWKLKLSCLKSAEWLAFYIHYDASRVRTDYVACLTTQFSALVKSVANDPQAAIGDLDILGDAERRRLLSLTNNTRFDSSNDECLHQLFETSAKQDPKALAVVCGDRPITYAELNAKANQLAHVLIRRGVGPDVLVALCMQRSVEMLIGMLGILKAGGAYVPLDPGNSRSRLAYEIAHAGAPVIVTQQALLPLLPDLEGTVLCLDRDVALLDREVHTDPGRPVAPQHLAYVIYTSGSTGVPKGVAVTHQSAVNYTRDMHRRLGVERGWHFATVSTIGADLGNTVIFASWVSGGYLHVIDYGTATDGRLFADYVIQHPIDVLKIVPSHLSALLSSSDGRNILPRKILILGGEALPVELADRLSRLSQCEIINHYGPTETTIGCLTFPWEVERRRLRSSSTVPIGRPIANTDVYILDEQFRQVPIGVPGELYIGGMGLARGYVRSPEQTAKRFLPHPFSAVPGSRLYKSGDLVRCWPDGAIEYLGRLDHQVKIRGYRVELEEIEARLLEHTEIREAVVTACDDGSGGKRLVGYVVGRRGDTFDVAALRHYLKDRLPEYMVPSAFVCLSSLPLTSNGKVHRKILPPPDATGHSRKQYIAPRTPVEKILAEIWADLLKVPNIGVHDNFFDLGGHSLLAIQLMHRVQKLIGHSLSLTTIFHAPTVTQLADLLSRAAAAAPSPLVALPAAGVRLPLYCFDPTGRHIGAYGALARSLDGQRPVYGLELGHLFHQNWNEVSITSIAERHANAICEHQREGPYYLLGWSLGGVIALAVARVLEQRKQRVAFLGILDTQARTSIADTDAGDVLNELSEFLNRDRRKEFCSLPSVERDALRSRLMDLSMEERIEHAVRWAIDKGFLPGDIPMEIFKLRYALLKDAGVMLNGDKGRSLGVPVHVWWTDKTLEHYGKSPINWQDYTTGIVWDDIIPGDHLDVVESPIVHQRIAEVLTDLEKGGLP
jgi:amino acid adenylation domain-containing protein